MKILQEFKTFAMKGNVIDLAVWVVIWGAFWKIVSSLVADIITPAFWILIWGINFKNLGYTIRNLKWDEVTITYGNFLQSMFDFIIIAFSIFMVIKIINKAQEKIIRKEKVEEKKEEIKREENIILLEEIRDLLKDDRKVNNTKSSKSQNEVIDSKKTEPETKKDAPKKLIAKKTPTKTKRAPITK